MWRQIFGFPAWDNAFNSSNQNQNPLFLVFLLGFAHTPQPSALQMQFDTSAFGP